MTYRLFHNDAEIDGSTASALLIDASVFRGFDIAELRAVFCIACDFSDHESLDSMMARETIFDSADIEIIPADSDSLVCNANPCGLHDGDGESVADSLTQVSDKERFAFMSFQSVANLVLRESASDSDRLKAWEYLNASAEDIGTLYWSGLSTMARSRILGAMALDLSAFGFITAEAESGVAI